MAIKNSVPLSLPETKEIVETLDTENKDIKAFLNKFVKLDLKKAKELRKELENLGLIKMKDKEIVKIIDILPEDAEDINKIFVDVSLNENEINKLLDVVKKYR